MSKYKELDYNNEKVPYRVSYGSLSKWQQETGKKLEDLELIEEDLSLLEPLFYHSVVLGYTVKGEQCPFSREGLELVLDECWLAFITGIEGFFQSGVDKKAVKGQKK